MTASTEVRALLAAIDDIDRIGNDAWLDTLDGRKKAELEFHNRDRDPAFRQNAGKAGDTFERFYGNHKYYRATRRSNEYIFDWIARNAKDKIFLDYACGNGGYSMFAAKAGAALVAGFDISDVSVRNVRATAEKLGLSANTRFFQADAENTKLPDASIDTVICSGMLHHLDLSYAFPELRRILKPGGKILAVEALDYNPAIKLYRYLTPAMRTEWEKAHILSLRDLTFAHRFFDVTDVRYWHVLGYVGGKFPILLPLLDGFDRVLEKIPYVNRLAWMFTFCLERPLTAPPGA
jgi:ubiquinone/menaquinone biosynthesis C-methylase UbiE